MRLRLGQRDEIVVMQLDAPAHAVGGVLREHSAADGVADRVLLPSIAAHLAPEHADRIGALSDRTVIPALPQIVEKPNRTGSARRPDAATSRRAESRSVIAARSSPFLRQPPASRPTTAKRKWAHCS